MRIAVLIICLVFLLPGGNFHVFKGSGHHSAYFPRTIKIADRFKNSPADHGHDTFANSNATGGEKWLDCGEVDDEDSSDSAPRKFRSHANIHSIHFYLAELSDHRDFPNALPSFWYQPSCRYILLRTFRV
jgi:hypothetical protein